MFLSSNSFLSQVIVFLFPHDCFERFFVQYDFLDGECMRLVASRFLGLGVTAGSALVLMPQIIKIQSGRSGAGVSLLSMLLAWLACMGTSGYSYAKRFNFSQWGDALFMTLQVSIIILQILVFSDRLPQALAFIAFLSATIGALYLNKVPMAMLTFLQAATIPITVFSKGIQIQTNISNRSTGQLSSISVGLQFIGCLARIFTSVQETNDQLVIITYIIASILNGIIFAQVLIYWGRKPPRKME